MENDNSGYQVSTIEKQISDCLTLLKNTFAQDLLGVYLFGSAIVGGLQKYSDIDLLVITDRSSTYDERARLVSNLLTISGVYPNDSKPPIEMTIVVKSEINPWRYPPKFDFQYGDWLRTTFESGHIEPWSEKEMPDLALLITQVLLAHKVLFGQAPEKLLCKIPYGDFLAATKNAVNHLIADLHSDTRNVLLTYARIWKTIETNMLCSKRDAATWVIARLPEQYQPVMKRAYAICIGEENEYWDDITVLIQPTANYMIDQISNAIISIELSDYNNKSIRIE